MNKGTIIGLVIAVIVIIAGVVGFAVYKNGGSENENTQESSKVINNTENISINENEENGTTSSSRKILVVYYSAQNHTREVAKQVAENLNADIFEITPTNVYTENDLDWTDNNSRVTKEHDDTSLRNVELTTTRVDNWEDYDIVLIGYPIWWGTAAWPTDTFVKNNDFTGKTIIPFCTSSSSGLGQSGDLLKVEAGTGNWEEGHRFQSSASSSEIKEWTDSLNLK